MNDSRHDKAIVVLLAYFIGFCTAFIAFGVNNTPDVVYNTFTLVEEVPQEASLAMSESNVVSLSTEKTGLYFNDGEKKVLLSADKNFFGDSTDQEKLVAGFHHSIVAALVSPNEKFVYYCEQLAKEENDCVPIVFDVEADTAYRLNMNGSNYSVDIETHKVTWDEEGLLTVNDFTSTTADKPWI